MTDSTQSASNVKRDAAIGQWLIRRRTVKGQLTTFHKFIDTMVEEPDYDYIQRRMEAISSFYQEYRDVQRQLEFEQPDNHDHERVREEIEVYCCRRIARARAMMRLSATAAGTRSEAENRQ